MHNQIWRVKTIAIQVYCTYYSVYKTAAHRQQIQEGFIVSEIKDECSNKFQQITWSWKGLLKIVLSRNVLMEQKI